MKRWDPKSLVTGQPMESAAPNKFIMMPARGSFRPLVMYAPVKVLTPRAYAMAKKRESK